MTRALGLFLLSAGVILAAPPSRLTRTVDAQRARAVDGTKPRQLAAQTDLGEASGDLRMKDITMFFRPSEVQQEELDDLLREQQNPSSANYHKWLTPEEFGDRFGLNASDVSKVSAWLVSQGLEVGAVGRARNWISFAGRAEDVGRALRTSIHRYRDSAGEHFANATDVSVPEALSEVTAGFLGLDDFRPQPALRGFRPIPEPEYNSASGRHYLAPQDFSTIYNVTPLSQGGYDGAGQSIVVVGQSAVSLSDMRTFRTRFGLPANDPRLLLYADDPGFNGAEIEGVLDLQWAGALAPRATIYYVYGFNAFSATIASINANLAPMISISYGTCEINIGVVAARGIFQQANAQGITIVNSSGDSGAAACETQGYAPFASKGRYVNFPTSLPEVTSVGGTQFNEGTGNYWATTNSSVLGSALSYIPEIAWNENDQFGLGSTGGGVSAFVEKPAWQVGPGVPAGNARAVPDVSFSAAGHVAYLVIYHGGLAAVGGTSASTPALAGVLTLLNQYQVRQGNQRAPGLGNINPHLYRMALTTPLAFHDITEGNNIVNCLQGSEDCATGSFGYRAGAGYDMATGLGTLDVNTFVRGWNQAVSAATVTLDASPGTVTLNDWVALYATVAAEGGRPTGSVAFSVNGTSLGTVVLSGNPGVATMLVPAYRMGVGNNTVTAVYSGDAGYGTSTASARVRVNLPGGSTGTSAVTVVAPSSAFANPPDAQGVSWQVSVGLRERNGSPALLTGFTIDGAAQSIGSVFPSAAIPANSTLTGNLVIRGARPGVTRVLGFTGTDASGVTWTREASVILLPIPGYLGGNASASPLTMQQNTAAPAACQWTTQVTVDNLFGYRLYLASFYVDNINRTREIANLFGTQRIEALGSLTGTLCFGNVRTPATSNLYFVYEDEFGDQFGQDLTVTFAGPAATAAQLTAAPATVSLAAPLNAPIAPSQALAVNVAAGQQWTAAVYPANRTTQWLQLSQYSGTGPGTITVSVNPNGFGAGAYRATVMLTSVNATPQSVAVPVMFVHGTRSGTAITGAGNALSLRPGAAPGMILAIYGTGLAAEASAARTQPLPYTIGNVTATVNGVPAPLLYVSPGQVNVQVPYWVGSGPGVVGVSNSGVVAGYQMHIAAAAPGILNDGKGVALPTQSAAQGGLATLYVTGDGEVNDAGLEPGFAPATGTPLAALPRPLQGLGVTVGGLQALVQFYGITPGIVGMTQVNYIVPASVATGVQPVVVTVGGVASPAANITVTAR